MPPQPSAGPAPPSRRSDLGLPRDIQGIVDLDAEIPHRRFQLGVPEEQLNSTQVLGSTMDERGLRPAHRVRTVISAVQSMLIDPMPEDAGVLPGAQMWGCVKAAGKQEVLGLQLSLLDPSLKCLPGSQCDFELHRALGLVLHDDGTSCHLITVTHIPDLQGDQIAAPKLAIDARVKEPLFRASASWPHSYLRRAV